MKKHILGVALFSLIVASFAIIYAFFYTPSLPPKEAVKPPVSQTVTREEKTYSCRFSRDQVSFEVLSSQFDLETKKITTKIKLSWNGEERAPKEVYTNLQLVTAGEFNKPVYIIEQKIVNPFNNGNQTITTIESEIPATVKIKEKENLYAFFSFSENVPAYSDIRAQKKSYQVLFIHGSKLRN